MPTWNSWVRYPQKSLLKLLDGEFWSIRRLDKQMRWEYH